MAEDDDLMSVQDFANKYRVDASVVRGWIKSGYIDYVLVGPRKMKHIHRSQVVQPIIPEAGNGSGPSGQQLTPDPKGAGRGKKARPK